jgi:hypothetical protein
MLWEKGVLAQEVGSVRKYFREDGEAVAAGCSNGLLHPNVYGKCGTPGKWVPPLNVSTGQMSVQASSNSTYSNTNYSNCQLMH